MQTAKILISLSLFTVYFQDYNDSHNVLSPYLKFSKKLSYSDYVYTSNCSANVLKYTKPSAQTNSCTLTKIINFQTIGLISQLPKLKI